MSALPKKVILGIEIFMNTHILFCLFYHSGSAQEIETIARVNHVKPYVRN